MKYYKLVEYTPSLAGRERIDEVTFKKLTPLQQSYYDLEVPVDKDEKKENQEYEEKRNWSDEERPFEPDPDNFRSDEEDVYR